jgi:hypothetical protein
MNNHNTAIRNSKTNYEEKMLLLLDKNLKEEATRIAYQNHMTANAFVREALRRNITAYKKADML